MYQTLPAPEPLRTLIDCFWRGTDEDLRAGSLTHLAVASSRIELLFFCRGGYTPLESATDHPLFPAGFFGHTTRPATYFSKNRNTEIFGIRFHPLASLVLLGLPAHELTHQRIDIGAIWGREGDDLAQRVFNTPAFTDRVALCTKLLLRKWKPLARRYLPITQALKGMDPLKTSRSISDLAARSHYSLRQFERNFKDVTGFSTKTYVKLNRFEKCMDRLLTPQAMTEKVLTRLALDFGYSDQAHFNHHFKEYTGMNPMAYLAGSRTT